MTNFWDSNVWAFILLMFLLLGSLLVGNIMKRRIPFLKESLIPTSVLGGIIILLVEWIYQLASGNKLFEVAAFGGNGNEFYHLTDRYFDADLLIIDDLGTEMSTQFTLSAFYDLINTRLNEGKCTIINTNLNVDALRTRYDDRITSRILGNFMPLIFRGNDVRALKLRQ